MSTIDVLTVAGLLRHLNLARSPEPDPAQNLPVNRVVAQEPLADPLELLSAPESILVETRQQVA